MVRSRNVSRDEGVPKDKPQGNAKDNAKQELEI
jgi:hypothetical protein